MLPSGDSVDGNSDACKLTISAGVVGKVSAAELQAVRRAVLVSSKALLLPIPAYRMTNMRLRSEPTAIRDGVDWG